MSVRSIWTGTVSFGLVAIPVRLIAAVRPGRVSFRTLHDKDYSPLTRRMYCPVKNRIINPEHIVRGYEIEKDKYVPVYDNELESLSPERSRTIEVMDFVDLNEIDHVFFNRPYYLLPSEGGEKPYRLLVEAMKKQNKCGVAKFVMRDREHLVILKTIGKALGLVTLHYANEVLAEDDVRPARTEVSKKEVERTVSVIKGMQKKFEPQRYSDEYQKKILELLNERAKKQGTVESPAATPGEGGARPEELIAALEESLEKAKKGE